MSRVFSVFAIILSSGLISCVLVGPKSSSVADREPASPECSAQITNGPGVDAAPSSLVSLHEYYRILTTVLARQPATFWPNSKILKPGNLCDLKRADQLAEMALNDNPAFAAEVDGFLANLGGKDSPAFWDVYFHSYDGSVGFNPAYAEIFVKAHQHLPKEGLILDIGCGTGNGSTILATLGPRRRIFAFDSSPYGLSLTRAKLKEVDSSTPGRFKVDQQNIMEWNKIEIADGAIMNNVLYSLADKQAALRKIFASLKKGARLVINDPQLNAVQTKASVGNLAHNFITGVIANRGPLSEFDWAVITRTNFTVLLKAANMSSPKSLIQMAEEAGFQFVSRAETYHGISEMFEFRKP